MAATGKTPILLYGSTTATNQPSAGNLTNSSDGCEIAINVADKNLFFKDATNTVNTVPIRQSSASSNGWLSSTDWSTFNGKVSSQWVTSGSNIYYSTGGISVGTSTYRNNLTAAGTTVTSPTLGTASGTAFFCGGDTAYGLMYGSAGSGNSWLQVQRVDGTATAYDLILQPSGGNVSTGAGNLVIGTSGKGIDFSATAGTGTSELLADYEEGTWTPTFTSSSGSFTSITYTSTGGRYTKIGNMVHVQGYIQTTAVTKGTAANTVRVSGLPYTVVANTASTLDGYSIVSVGYSDFGGTHSPQDGYVNPNTTTMEFTYANSTSGGPNPVITVADMSTTTNYIMFSASYISA